jgi:hypothetical protein
MINPFINSHQIAASGSFLLGNTGRCSGSYLIGQGSGSRAGAFAATMVGAGLGNLAQQGLPNQTCKSVDST